MENIIQLISYLAITSMAAERVTEIYKRAFSSVKTSLLTHTTTETCPSGLQLQIVSSLMGGVICYLSPPDLALLKMMHPISMSEVVGLATSGGSSMWHDLLATLSTYRKNLAAQ